MDNTEKLREIMESGLPFPDPRTDIDRPIGSLSTKQNLSIKIDHFEQVYLEYEDRKYEVVETDGELGLVEHD